MLYVLMFLIGVTTGIIIMCLMSMGIKEKRKMIIFDGMKLIGIAIMIMPLIICGILGVIARVDDAVTKQRNKRIDADSILEDKSGVK